MSGPDKPQFDVEKAIEASSRKTSLRALQEKGYKNVRVLDHKKINELITEAVAATFERLGPKVGALDGEKVHADAREEFLKLLYQNQQPPETVEQELRARLRTLESRVNELLGELGRKDEEFAAAKAAADTGAQQLALAAEAEQRAALEAAAREKDEELAKLRTERQEALDRLATAQTRSASPGMQVDPQELAAALESSRADLKEARQQIMELEAELATWEQGPDPKDLSGRLRTVEQTVAERDAALEALRKEMEEKLAKAPRVLAELAARLMARLADDKRRRKLMEVGPAAIEQLKQPEEILAVTLAGPLDATLVRYAADVDPLRREVERLGAELAALKEKKGLAPEGEETGKEEDLVKPDLAEIGLRRRGRHYVKRSEHFHRQAQAEEGEREAS